MARFLLRELRPNAELDLPAGEARHAARSRRLAPGDRLTLFDGQGRAAEAEVVRVDEGRVTVRSGDVRVESPVRTVVIAAAVPKGRRLAWMVQKLTELGVGAFQPVAFRRSVVRWSASRAARLEKVVAEAAKQSGRSDLMRLDRETAPEGLASAAGDFAATYVAVPSARETLMRRLTGAFPARVIIGPEGGLEPEEERLLGGIPVSLGRGVLRIETAAVAAAAVLAQA